MGEGSAEGTKLEVYPASPSLLLPASVRAKGILHGESGVPAFRRQLRLCPVSSVAAHTPGSVWIQMEE